MLANRYIQAVLTHDIVEELKQDAAGTLQQRRDRADREAKHIERAELSTLRFVDLDRRFGI
jgi:hypothetical protein